MNSKILCVAEKPSVAKEVARILNNNQQQELLDHRGDCYKRCLK